MFDKYIESVGGQNYAAKRLGVSHTILSRIMSGKAGVSKKLAKKIEEDSLGRFKKEDVVFSKDDDK